MASLMPPDGMQTTPKEKSLLYGKIKHLGGGRFAKVSLLEKNKTCEVPAFSSDGDSASKKVFSKSVGK